MATYSITLKDFGEAVHAGTFTNLKALDTALQNIVELNQNHNPDADLEAMQDIPQYSELVKMFKAREQNDQIVSPEYTLEDNSNNVKTLKITCIRDNNVIVAW